MLELKVGESVRIGEATVTLDEKSGRVARLSIDAGKDVPITRVQAPASAQSMAKNGLGALQPA